jgi:hypothetical protein
MGRDEGDSTVARLNPITENGKAAGPQARRTRAVWWRGGERLAVRAERAVRHCGKFPNAHVAPLRAVRQRKPLWLLQWCRTF